ncbi:MAG: endonuclease, partial [Candidatus Cloacimonadaceae bacterium]|nr:endonuclease [Candidatus Cloacimonadaceae bacterium]
SNSWDVHWQASHVDGEIIVSGEMGEFVAIAGAPSDRDFYTVTGVDLTSNITVTAPAGFQVSLLGLDTWSQAIVLPPDYSGNVWVRMFVAEEGYFTGAISHTSGGADPVYFNVSGEAFAPEGEIIITADMQPFFTASGVPSAIQTYAVSGSSLDGDIIVTASAPYQISLAGAGNWQSVLTLPSTFNGNIDVRLNSATAGTFNGTITHASVNVSNETINVSGTVSQSVANINALRSLPTGTQYSYTLTGEAILTYQKLTRNQKYIQDGTAAILIDDLNGIITTTYNLGDGITGITGYLSAYASLLQFVPTRNSAPATSSGNVIVPEIRTLASLTAADQAKLVKVLDVSFTNPEGNFASGVNMPISDPSGTSIFRTGFTLDDGCNYINTPIPATPKNIIALVGQFNTDMQITARFLADFSDPVPAVATKLAITNINPESPYINSAFSVTVQAQDENNIPRNVSTDTAIGLTLNSGTGSLGGTLQGTITTGSNSVVISGVTFNTTGTITLLATATSGMTLLPATSGAITIQSVPAEATAAVVSRPTQIDISQTSSQSAVLMQLQSYPTDDIRYRLFSGSFQYNCWNGTEYITSTTYANGPQPIGTPTTSATWWIVFERGNNVSVDATYRDRQGPAYGTNYKSVVLPTATEITDAFSISITLPLNPGRYDFNNKYVVLGYDAEIGGTLISATSTDLGTGSYSLKVQSGTTIRRLEVRALDNTLVESLTGEWDDDSGDSYYEAVEGLTGSALRAGLRTITSTGHINNSWDNTRYHIYAALDNVNDTVTCVYTGEVYTHPAGGNYTPTGLSAEHTFPREWFTGHTDYDLMDTDLHALFPANNNANSARSNYPYDYITNITSSWGTPAYISWGGTNSGSTNAFEVADQFKGDAARALLYMVMRYYENDNALVQFSTNQLPILLQWHFLDPVSDYEIARNNGKFLFQGNRNPFVDHPEWVSSIWGDLALAAPVATVPSNVGEHQFTANWNAVAGATSYRLDVSTNNTFTAPIAGYKNKIVGATSQTVSGLDPAVTYYYRVRAIGAGGILSPSSNTIFATTTVGGSVAFYWNFNSNVPASGLNWDQPIPATIGNGSITYNLTKAVSFTGTTVNGEAGEVNGGSFVPQGGDGVVENNGNHMEIAMPTTGLQNIVLSYATQRTTAGFNAQEIHYSVDGNSFQLHSTVTNIPTAFGFKSVDFTGVTGVDNNPNFKIRIIFTGASNATGNNRIDNLKVFAASHSGGDLSAPQNIAISTDGTNVTISWNAVDGAASYRLYSSDDPYVFGTNYTEVFGTQTTIPASAAKKFYRVTAAQ